jgi:hypothetical protein
MMSYSKLGLTSYVTAKTARGHTLDSRHLVKVSVGAEDAREAVLKHCRGMDQVLSFEQCCLSSSKQICKRLMVFFLLLTMSTPYLAALAPAH